MRYCLLIISALTLLFTQKANSQSTSMIDLTKITVREYVELLKSIDTQETFHFVVIEVNAPKDWITEKDLEYLNTLVDSDEPSNCVMHVYSSLWPTGKSTIGGQVGHIIDAHNRQEEYPHFLTSCATTKLLDIDLIKD